MGFTWGICELRPDGRGRWEAWRWTYRGMRRFAANLSLLQGLRILGFRVIEAS